MADPLALVHATIHRRFHWAVDSGSEYDALLSAGWEGLRDAEERYDPTRGLSFSTFAIPRIRGAILDYLNRERGSRRKAQVDFAPLECAASVPCPSTVDAVDRVDIERALSTLDPQERDAVVQFTMLDRRQADIARDWGRTFSRVGQVHRRAMSKLRLYYGVIG